MRHQPACCSDGTVKLPAQEPGINCSRAHTDRDSAHCLGKAAKPTGGTNFEALEIAQFGDGFSAQKFRMRSTQTGQPDRVASLVVRLALRTAQHEFFGRCGQGRAWIFAEYRQIYQGERRGQCRGKIAQD